MRREAMLSHALDMLIGLLLLNLLHTITLAWLSVGFQRRVRAIFTISVLSLLLWLRFLIDRFCLFGLNILVLIFLQVLINTRLAQIKPEHPLLLL